MNILKLYQMKLRLHEGQRSTAKLSYRDSEKDSQIYQGRKTKDDGRVGDRKRGASELSNDDFRANRDGNNEYNRKRIEPNEEASNASFFDEKYEENKELTLFDFLEDDISEKPISQKTTIDVGDGAKWILNHKPKEINPSIKELKNFIITDEIQADKLSPSERLNYNVEAISMLRRIEKGERKLDISAQEVLAKYVGWGGLSEVFDEERSGQWEIAREFLKENLSPLEYEAAKESTLTAFYTPKVVIDAPEYENEGIPIIEKKGKPEKLYKKVIEEIANELENAERSVK